MESGIHLGKIFLLPTKNKYLKDFSAFLWMGKYKNLGAIKFLLRYTSYTSNYLRGLIVQSTEHPVIIFIFSIWSKSASSCYCLNFLSEAEWPVHRCLQKVNLWRIGWWAKMFFCSLFIITKEKIVTSGEIWQIPS